MGGGTFNPEKPVFPGQPVDVDSLRRELAGLAGIAQAYAEIQKRLDHEVEMREWAEREEVAARREAEETRRMFDRERMEIHADKCVADYRNRAWEAERKLERIKTRVERLDVSNGDRAFEAVAALLTDWDEV